MQPRIRIAVIELDLLASAVLRSASARHAYSANRFVYEALKLHTDGAAG
jgi:hypothetical protein